MVMQIDTDIGTDIEDGLTVVQEPTEVQEPTVVNEPAEVEELIDLDAPMLLLAASLPASQADFIAHRPILRRKGNSSHIAYLRVVDALRRLFA